MGNGNFMHPCPGSSPGDKDDGTKLAKAFTAGSASLSTIPSNWEVIPLSKLLRQSIFGGDIGSYIEIIQEDDHSNQYIKQGGLKIKPDSNVEFWSFSANIFANGQWSQTAKIRFISINPDDYKPGDDMTGGSGSNNDIRIISESPIATGSDVLAGNLSCDSLSKYKDDSDVTKTDYERIYYIQIFSPNTFNIETDLTNVQVSLYI